MKDAKTSHIPHLLGFKQFMRLEIGMADNTVKAYLSDIEALLDFYKGDLLTLTPENVVSFMAFMRLAGNSLETILRRLSGVSQYYDFLIVERVLKTNPIEFIAKPRRWRKLPVFLEFEEVDKILAAGDMATPKGYRDALMLETLYASGMRVSELIGVKVADVDFRRGIVKVTGKGSKQRIVPLYGDIVEKIQNYLVIRSEYFVKNTDTGFLFLNNRGEALTRQHVWLWVKEACGRAGVKKNVSPHTLRHCFATHLLSGGADLRTIQIFLGHSNISTTEIYTHVTDNDKRSTLLAFHPRYKR